MLFWYVRGGVVTHLVCIFCNCAYLKVSLFCSTVRTFLSLPLHLWISKPLLLLWFTLPDTKQYTAVTILIEENVIFSLCHSNKHNNPILFDTSACLTSGLSILWSTLKIFSCFHCIIMSYNGFLSAHLAVNAHALNSFIVKISYIKQQLC